MEGLTPDNFLATWHQSMIIAAIVMTACSLLIFIYHSMKVSGTRLYKSKYDYIRENEIKTYRIAFILLAIAVACMINTYGKGSLTDFDPIWFNVRLFFGIAGGTLIGYIAYLILEYYYPSRLHNKLMKWRYKPRVNPNNGNQMRLLSEAEEDVHLDEGMQAEENVFSIDYDVWIDETSGYTQIEKYPGHLQALQCNNCGFYTMKVETEEIIKAPTRTEEGALIKNYKCQYCDSVRATQFTIAKEQELDTYYKPVIKRFPKDTPVEAIKLEIHTVDGNVHNYEFQHMEQARDFLSEYDYENLNNGSQ